VPITFTHVISGKSAKHLEWTVIATGRASAAQHITNSRINWKRSPAGFPVRAERNCPLTSTS